MLGPVTTPEVIKVDLNCLVLLVDTFGKKVLNAGILGIGNVWADVEQKASVVTKRRRSSAMVGILVVHYGFNTLGVELVSGTEAAHSASQDNDVWHLKSLS